MAKPARRRKVSLAQRRAAINKLRGILRPKPGEPSLAAVWAKLDERDRAIEKRHEDFLDSIGRGKPMINIDEFLQRLRPKAGASEPPNTKLRLRLARRTARLGGA